MPTRARTSEAHIVAAARHILETRGLDALTMQAVAHAVGVRGPSLYKRVRDRGDLIRLISNDLLNELGARLDAVVQGEQPGDDLRAMADAYRSFAHAHPRAYALLFSPVPDEWRADAALNERVSSTLVRSVAALAGEADVLPAARTVVAWIHGFVSMELAGAFRLGGDVDAAFAYGIDRLRAALEHS